MSDVHDCYLVERPHFKMVDGDLVLCYGTSMDGATALSIPAPSED